jgi:hypothetical protein
MLDEETAFCIDIELVVLRIWGTDPALLGQEYESLKYLTYALDQSMRSLWPLGSIAVTKTNLGRIASLTISEDGAAISRQNFIV